MKKITILLIIVVMNSCNHSNVESYLQAIPNNTDVNNVLIEVIDIDSLNIDYRLECKLKNIKVFKQKQRDNDSIPLPPPPPFSITYDELFLNFGSSNDRKRRLSDSIFFSLQTDTAIKYKVQDELISSFNINSVWAYQFYKPIFSFNKQYVYIQYHRIYREMFSDCNAIVLKWDGVKWNKLNDWSCGEH